MPLLQVSRDNIAQTISSLAARDEWMGCPYGAAIDDERIVFLQKSGVPFVFWAAPTPKTWRGRW